MAYWLYCQSCKQWNKSATGLSEDKLCPLCNSLFVKTKPYSLPNNTVDKALNMPERRQASKTVELLIEEDPIKTSSSCVMIETPATASDKFQPQEADEGSKAGEASMAAHQNYETFEVKEFLKSPEMNRVVEITAAAEEQAPENPEKYGIPPVELPVQDDRYWSNTQEAGYFSSIEPVLEQESAAVQAVYEEEFESDDEGAEPEIEIDEAFGPEEPSKAAADCETAITTETSEALAPGEADQSNESNTEKRDLKKFIVSSKMAEDSDEKTEFEEAPNRPKMTRVHERYMEMMRRTKNQHPHQPQP